MAPIKVPVLTFEPTRIIFKIKKIGGGVLASQRRETHVEALLTAARHKASGMWREKRVDGWRRRCGGRIEHRYEERAE